jgi:hypothetical protein
MSVSLGHVNSGWTQSNIKNWAYIFLHEISHLLGLNDVYRYTDFATKFGFSPEKEIRLSKYTIMQGYKEDLSPIGKFGEFDLYLLKKMYGLD